MGATRWLELSLPTCITILDWIASELAAENGIEPVERCVDLMAGNLSLILETRDRSVTDEGECAYVGPIVWQLGAVSPKNS
jgi:hypothetical protein